MVELWQLCRGAMGELARLPDDGGVNEQAAWLLDAFLILSDAYSSLKDGAR